MAANDSVRVRVTDLVTKLLEYVRDGKRDANDVARVLQVVKDDPNFIRQLFPESLETLEGQLKFSKRLKTQLKNWKSLYRKEFNIELDISRLRIPPHVPGFDRLIVVAKGLTLYQIIPVLRKHMKVWIYTNDLDTIVSARTTTEAYAIWVRNDQEADSELKNKSAHNLKDLNINCITLVERWLLELQFYLESGLHLDVKNTTLCGDSRCSGGCVPSVDWDSGEGKVSVHCALPFDAASCMRARQVIA